MDYFPPVGYHFVVRFIGLGGRELDTRFQSVSGLAAELQMESVREGGENRFEHQLPTIAQYQPLSLKRGLVPESDISEWVRDALENLLIIPRDVVISLLNEEQQPLMTWSVVGAIPKKWSVAEFNAEQNALVVETFDLAFRYFRIQ
jgi:phage tail-like protein